jgi:hypothetical protein
MPARMPDLYDLIFYFVSTMICHQIDLIIGHQLSASIRLLFYYPTVELLTY